MLSFEHKKENPTIERIELKPGTYYFRHSDAGGDVRYRKIIITDISIGWVTVQNDDMVYSISIAPPDDYVPWHIESCFSGNGDFTKISGTEFKKLFNDVKSKINAIII